MFARLFVVVALLVPFCATAAALTVRASGASWSYSGWDQVSSKAGEFHSSQLDFARLSEPVKLNETLGRRI